MTMLATCFLVAAIMLLLGAALFLIVARHLVDQAETCLAEARCLHDEALAFVGDEQAQVRVLERVNR